jgi:TrmH family RNA methyltransferase
MTNADRTSRDRGIIASAANEKLKFARRVRDGREDAWIFVEGERLVEECLQSGLGLQGGFYSPGLSDRGRAILEELAARQCPLYQITDPLMADLADTVHPQGIVVLAGRPVVTLQEAIAGAQPLIVCLDAIQDPGNLGSMLRTAEAAGATGVIALKGCAAAFSPKVLRSAMGSAFRLPVAVDVTIEDFLAVLARFGIRIIATAATGEIAYDAYDWRQPTALLLGNEARGVRAELLERCDARLRIPLRPPVESLNVAAAAAVLLFEAERKRRSESGLKCYEYF